VEVQRNAYGPSEAERITRAFRGGHGAVHRAADAFVRYVPRDVEAGLKGALGLRGDNNLGVSPDQHPHSQGEGTVIHAPESAHVTLKSSAEPENTNIREDEDGWVSDQSLPGDIQAQEGHQRTVMRHSSRANKKKRTERHHPSIHNHHHHHHHRSRLSHPAPINMSTSTESSTVPAPASAPAAGPSTPAPDVPSSAVPGALSPSLTDAADEEPRGRTPAASAPSTVAARSSRRPRPHMRIVSLRGSEVPSREVSPVRSIRWADAGAGNSPATARWPQSPPASVQGSRAPSPGPSTPSEPAEQDAC